MGMTQSQRVGKIIQNFENNLCIYGCEVKVESVYDPCSYLTYKCPKCGNAYTAKSVFKAIKLIYER